MHVLLLLTTHVDLDFFKFNRISYIFKATVNLIKFLFNSSRRLLSDIIVVDMKYFKNIIIFLFVRVLSYVQRNFQKYDPLNNLK